MTLQVGCDVVFVCASGDATEIKLRDLKPAADYFVKYVNLIADSYLLLHCYFELVN